MLKIIPVITTEPKQLPFTDPKQTHLLLIKYHACRAVPRVQGGGKKKKNKKQKQVGDMEYSVKLKLIQMKKACKDVLSEAASESEHMHLLNTPEVHQRSVLNPGFSVCFSGSIKDCSLVTKSTSTKQ